MLIFLDLHAKSVTSWKNGFHVKSSWFHMCEPIRGHSFKQDKVKTGFFQKKKKYGL